MHQGMCLQTYISFIVHRLYTSKYKFIFDICIDQLSSYHIKPSIYLINHDIKHKLTPSIIYSNLMLRKFRRIYRNKCFILDSFTDIL